MWVIFMDDLISLRGRCKSFWWPMWIKFIIKLEKIIIRIRRQKKSRSCQKSQKWSLGLREVVLTPYDEIESCREWKVESSHMCKNSSRRTPRPKNLIFILCFNKKGRKTKKGDENSKNTYKSLSLFSTFRRMYQLYNNFEKNQETRTRIKNDTPLQKKSKNEFRTLW